MLRHFGKTILYLVELNNISWEGWSRNRVVACYIVLLRVRQKGWPRKSPYHHTLSEKNWADFKGVTIAIVAICAYNLT